MVTGKTKTVEYLNKHRPDLQFIVNSQDVEPIKQELTSRGYADYFLAAYDSFFVGVKDGEYTQVWGMEGTFPAFEKIVTRLI